jgi:hypothetical protein
MFKISKQNYITIMYFNISINRIKRQMNIIR